RQITNHFLNQAEQQRAGEASDVIAYVIDTRFAKHTSLREPARRARPVRDSVSGSEEVEPLQDAGLAAVRRLLPLTFVLYLKQL
ncbi:hypothetical protein INR49_004163, partial [Caranx melampygus]